MTLHGRHLGERIGLGAFVCLVFTFLFLPLAVVVLFSFNDSPSLSLPFRGFTTHWYSETFANDELMTALERSLFIAIVTSLVTLVLGTAAAYGISLAKPGKVRAGIAALFFLPITVPGLFLGLALFSLFTRGDVSLGNPTIIIAHCVYVFPFFLLIAAIAFRSFDPAIEEVARDLGASRPQVFFKAVFPLVWPVLVGASAVAFMLSFDEFVVTFFVAGSDQTLPLYLFGALKRPIDPTVNVISTLLLSTTLLFTLIGTLVIGRGLKRELDDSKSIEDAVEGLAYER